MVCACVGACTRALARACVCVCGRFQQSFSHITRLSGCGGELIAHFYAVLNQCGIKFQTL